MLWKSSPPCHVFRIFWGMTIYRTPYYCLGYIHTRRESLFSFFFFFSFLTPLPLKQTQRHAAGGEGGAAAVLFSGSCCLHMPVRLVNGLTDSTELMNHASEDRWVSGAAFRSHVRPWPHAAFPPTLVCRRQPRLCTLPATDLLHNGALESAGRCHSVTSSFFHFPPQPYIIIKHSWFARWFLYISAGIWSKKQQPERQFEED